MRVLAIAVAVAVLGGGCGLGQRGGPPPGGPSAADLLPDVRVARDRPPVVLVSREGDPAVAVAVAVTTAWARGDAEPAVALGGVLEARLAARGHDAIVTPSWDGIRATVLVGGSKDDARLATDALRDALLAPIEAKDLAPARKKLTALAQRPLRDEALETWARCVGSPFGSPGRAGKTHDDLTLAQLESWRASSATLGRVAFAAAARPAVAEEVASAIAAGPAWAKGQLVAAAPARHDGAEVKVFEAAGETSPLVYATLDVESSSAAAFIAEALGDPRGPLATRLSNLELPYRLREVTGTAHASGGCVGVVLESEGDTASADIATRVADAVALVHVEAGVHLTEGRSPRDGRTLARRAGDAREAAERGAWWALTPADPAVRGGTSGALGGSVALAVPGKRGGAPKEKLASGDRTDPAPEAVAAALERAMLAWKKPASEARVRVERGQGETWVLVASPCGTDAEGESDAGLTALFVAAAADQTKSSPDARVEPWIVPDGAGLLVHGPALAGETPAAHARRLANVAARSFAAEPLTAPALSRARGALLRRDAASDGAAFSSLAAALSPQHPSWVLATGREEVLARSSDAAVIARGHAVRSGPLRVAILANVDAAQGEAAHRAADRWIERRSGEARSCKIPEAASPPKPGTYAATPRAGASPEAYLAFPFAPGDEKARAAAHVASAALEGSGALLDRALGGSAALARSSSARVLGWPRAPALVVRVVSSEAQLDAAVMQTRALLERLRQGGLPQADLDRAQAAAARANAIAALDPRARIVATWRGEPVAPAPPRVRATNEDVRAFAQRHLAEDAMIVVASRPGRPRSP